MFILPFYSFFSCIVNSGVSRISLKKPKYILPSVPFPMSLLVPFLPFFKPSLPFILIPSLYVHSLFFLHRGLGTEPTLSGPGSITPAIFCKLICDFLHSSHNLVHFGD